MINDNLKKIIYDDDTRYSAQMFFTIYINDMLRGVVFFFRLNGDYISSSSKAPKTICKFLQDFLNKKYISKSKMTSSTNNLFGNNLESINERTDYNMDLLTSNKSNNNIFTKMIEFIENIFSRINARLKVKFLKNKRLVIKISSFINYLFTIIGIKVKK